MTLKNDLAVIAALADTAYNLGRLHSENYERTGEQQSFDRATNEFRVTRELYEDCLQSTEDANE